jgi:hypothetical protein
MIYANPVKSAKFQSTICEIHAVKEQLMRGLRKELCILIIIQSRLILISAFDDTKASESEKERERENYFS